MTAIGFVGLGAMGGRIAGRLLDAGNTVYGTNRTRSSAEPLVERGMIWHDSPREVAEQAEVIFSMVTDSAALEAITRGPLAGLGLGGGGAPRARGAGRSRASRSRRRRPSAATCRLRWSATLKDLTSSTVSPQNSIRSGCS